MSTSFFVSLGLATPSSFGAQARGAMETRRENSDPLPARAPELAREVESERPSAVADFSSPAKRSPSPGHSDAGPENPQAVDVRVPRLSKQERLDQQMREIQIDRPRNILLTALGFGLFGLTYFITMIAGSVQKELSNERYGGRLMIPLVGPWVAMPAAETVGGTAMGVLSGILQAGALGMGIAGAILLGRENRRLDRAAGVAFAPLPGGASLGYRLRF